jgi:hypothetical protein
VEHPTTKMLTRSAFGQKMGVLKSFPLHAETHFPGQTTRQTNRECASDRGAKEGERQVVGKGQEWLGGGMH